MRAAKALLVIFLVALFGWHVRTLRRDVARRGTTIISTKEKLRSVTHDVILRDASLDHAITLLYAIDLSTETTITLAPEIKITGGPVAFDVLDRPVFLETRMNKGETKITFAPPPPAFGAARQVTIAFTTDAPPLRYGWGYRARPLPWATTFAAPRVPSLLQAHVSELVSASGWGCTYGESGGRICALSLSGRRRSVSIPMKPSRDVPWRLVFAAALGAAISFVMWANYRRWSKHADAMGMRDDDEIPTTEEFIAEYRRTPKVRRVEPSDEIDPFDAVALVARAITAVLGLIGSIFLVSHFESGFFPIIGPLALAIWAALAGLVLTVAVGIDRPRPWVALGGIVVLSIVAAIPNMRWTLPGLLPLLAATLMQLTAKES